LLFQAVLAGTIIILILLDIKNSFGAILELSNSIGRVAEKAEAVVETAQRRVDQIFTLKGVFEFVSSFFSESKTAKTEYSETDSSPKREKRRVKII
jgi:hypothetical protein